MEIGYERLCAAIVWQACKDIFKDRTSKNFFFSEWFKMLMPNLDGPKLYEKCVENKKETGNVFLLQYNAKADDAYSPVAKMVTEGFF